MAQDFNLAVNLDLEWSRAWTSIAHFATSIATFSRILSKYFNIIE
jgi:hypothetical protein